MLLVPLCHSRGARYITDFDGRLIFCTIFHEYSKNIFFSKLDTPNRRTSSAHVACSRAGTWAAWAEVVRRLGVSNLEKNYIFGIRMKNCRKYLSASSIGRNFFQSGHPYPQTLPYYAQNVHTNVSISILIKICWNE